MCGPMRARMAMHGAPAQACKRYLLLVGAILMLLPCVLKQGNEDTIPLPVSTKLCREGRVELNTGAQPATHSLNPEPKQPSLQNVSGRILAKVRDTDRTVA